MSRILKNWFVCEEENKAKHILGVRSMSRNSSENDMQILLIEIRQTQNSAQYMFLVICIWKICKINLWY